MQRTFHFLIGGVMIAVIILIGAWGMWPSKAWDDSSFASAAPEEYSPDDGIPVRQLPIVESGVAAGVDTMQPVAQANPLEEASSAQIGTIDYPLTDMDVILDRVAEFAQRQEQALFGRAGWLRVSQTMSSSEPASGDYYRRETDEMIPMATLVPENPTFETWYHINETGAYIEGMSLVTSQAGTVHQQTILVDGNWLNLTLRGPDAYRRKQYKNTVWVDEPLLTVSITLNTLKQEREWPNTIWHAYSDGGQFTLITEQHFDSPITNDPLVEEPILGARKMYVFDEESGRLLLQEVHHLLENDKSLLMARFSPQVEEFMLELPAETLRLFDEAVSRVAKSR